MAIKGLLTDLDGTLCSTEEANVAAYRSAFQDADVAFDEAQYRNNFGLDFYGMMRVIAPDAQEKWDLIGERKTIHYRSFIHLVQANETLIKILKDARDNGKKIGLASTAKRINAKSVLEHLHILDLFDAMIFAEDVTHKKPHPECYTKLIDALSLSPAECVVFEDTDIGVKAATAAGANVLRVKV